ncbi:MAG: lectin, partial [Deltaproteobacteria bacterium]|nr:lectin [Deltaproteobacteria bacterium]
MRQIQLAVAMAILALVGMTLDAAQDQNASMSFFVTREGAGNGANLGGLDGADRYCQKLAAAAGAGSRTWRAYLSASAMDGKPAVNARDRIGAGPWHNAKGVKIADNVADLHSDHNNLKRET